MNAPITPLPFDQAWTLEDTRRLHEIVSEDAARAHQQTLMKELLEQLELAVGRHAWHLAQTRGLQMPPHAEFAQTRFLERWRQAASGTPMEAHELQQLGYTVSHTLLSQALLANPRFARSDCPVLDVEQLHEALTQQVVSGNFESYRTEREECRQSGLSLSLDLVEWTPSYTRFVPEERAFKPLAPGDIVQAGLEHLVIPLPSGKLLVSDWFRNKAFQELTDAVLEGAPSINSAAGCVEHTRRLATLGVGSVYVGNTCPEVVSSPGLVRIGSVIDEAEEAQSGQVLDGHRRGMVITDLWWATMVDKQVLVSLLARSMPVQEASAAVDELIASQASDITQVDLPPGDYHLYFAGEPEVFAGNFDMEQVQWPAFDAPMLALSAIPLVPRSRPATPRP